MPTRRPKTEPRVLPIIRRIRKRWRLRMTLRGTATVLGASFVAFLISAYGLELLRFSAEAVTGLRVATWAVVAILAAIFLIRPLLRRIDDERVALYLEEHEPSLEAAILGAVQVEREGGGAGASPELLSRLVDRAVAKARDVENGDRIEQRGLYRASGGLAAVTVAVLLFLFLGPADLRYGMNALFFPTTDAAEVNPYSIGLTPGDVVVARGSDQMVTARLEGFASDEVYVFTRSGDASTYQRLSMLTGVEGGFELLLLNLQENTDYFVESNGVRSPTHTIEVAELPYVDQMDQTYRFPAYTDLEPRIVEDGGDVAALRGTEVELRIRSTLPTQGGRLLMDDEAVMELEPGPDGTLLGRFTVEAAGVYEIELAREDGRMVSASPEYTVDVLSDLPPSVSIETPGRDVEATAIEEFYVEARADDDYGVRDVRLVYSVNGTGEDTLTVFDGSGPPLTEVSASHTFFLEEWELEAGDVVSYYAVARDNRQTGVGEIVSDIYFVNVRPFGIEYREAEQQGGGGGGGGGGAGGGPESALSELQRQVVSATFNVLRDEENYTAEQFQENLVSVALAQGRVREQVGTLVQRMNNRGVTDADPRFREIAELLPGALEDMETAEQLLRDSEPREALAPEQRALRVLQKAEESYERMVQQQQQAGGGGGGGGAGANAEDLADLFELEMDKLQNQYETVQRGRQQQAGQQVDELMEKLEELARRQQQEMERQRRQAAGQQGAQGGAAGESQRQLAEEAEETARQLERLARESGDAELQETARRLQEAAESMRRSAANSGRSQGAADAGSALDDIEEARRRLERTREDRMRESAQDAMQRVERLAESQRQVQDELERLSEDPAQQAEDVRRIVERKNEMVRETQDLEGQLKNMAADARREDAEAAQALDSAANVITNTKLQEKLAWSRGVVQQRGDEEFAREFEDQIAADIESLRQQMGEAARAAQEIAENRGLEEALEESRDLVRATESLSRRLENRNRQDQQGEEGGQQGQEGGQQGQQGQQGDQQQGQEGQQEGQAGGQQGQDGQQGQQGQAGGQGGDTPPDSSAAGAEGRRLERGQQQGQQQGEGQQRASDQAGAQGAGGQGDPTDIPGGGRLPSGDPSFGGGATGGVPQPFTDEEIRQYQREFQEREQQARELRRTLAEEGREVSDLDQAIEVMEQLQQRESYEDLPNIPILEETLSQSLKRVEFTLRREVEGEGAGRASLSGSDEVPSGFRELVEEYYRSLARGGSGGDGG